MRQDAIDRINGVGMVLRFITPLMTGVILAMLSTYLQAQAQLQRDIREINQSLNNHITSFQMDLGSIKGRLGRIEGILEHKLRP